MDWPAASRTSLKIVIEQTGKKWEVLLFEGWKPTWGKEELKKKETGTKYDWITAAAAVAATTSKLTPTRQKRKREI